MVLAVAAVAAVATPHEVASASTRSVPVWQGVEREEWTLSTPSGSPVSAQVLQVTQPGRVALRPVLGQGRVAGLETLDAMGRRLLPGGAVAGINGGFWLYQPFGEPNSYLAIDGQLVSEAETQGSTMRGTLGVTADGRPLVDRVATSLRLRGEGAFDLAIDGVNRYHRGGALDRDTPGTAEDGGDVTYVYTPHFGPQVTVPGPGEPASRGPATALVLDAVVVPAAGTSTSEWVGYPEAVQPGESVEIPAGGAVVLAYGERRQQLQGVVEGTQVTIETTVSTVGRDRASLWADVREGIAAGPLLLQDGEPTVPQACFPEGFDPGNHCGVRAPRSAIGHKRDGRLILAVVDGRQAGHSAGMTMLELAEFMLRLGAVEAIALDGGGSSTIVVDGRVTNRPSDGRPRLLSNGLFLFHDDPLDHTERLAGSGREATAAAIALDSYPEGADEALIAAGGDYPDALAGGPLASRLGAPLLLSRHASLPQETAEALRTLGPRSATVLGGTAAISDNVLDQLRALGIDVRRIAGPSRVETAARVAETMGGGRDRVFVAWQGGFADALSAAAPAGMLDAPIVLSATNSLPEASAAALRASGAREVVLVGGTRVLGPDVEEQVRAVLPGADVHRLAGSTRFGTARAVNVWARQNVGGLDTSALVVAQGGTFPDALAGGPLAAARRQLLMILPAVDVNYDPDTVGYLDTRRNEGLDHVTLLGGYAVLSSYQQLQLDHFARE
jgi:putative cell wall-binding protein